LFHNGQSKSLPKKYWQRAVDLLDIMEAVDYLDDLKAKGFPPSLRLHKLKGKRKAEYAIDIHKTDGWRITFKFENNEFVDVKVEDYH
jgi:plasmid maintenance system killer protein